MSNIGQIGPPDRASQKYSTLFDPFDLSHVCLDGCCKMIAGPIITAPYLYLTAAILEAKSVLVGQLEE